MQQATSNKESEITQLKLTIASLRTALNKAKLEQEKLLQKKTAESAQEIETLKKNLIKLRRKLKLDQNKGQEK